MDQETFFRVGDPFTDDLLDAAEQADQHDDTVQQQHMILEALAECARAGSPPDALEMLAHELGVSREYSRIRP